MNRKNGFALPAILLFFLIFTLLAVGIGVKFKTISRQSAAEKSFDTRYGGAFAGTQWAKYYLSRPDDPTQAVLWQPGTPPQTFELNLNGEKVTVTIENATTT